VTIDYRRADTQTKTHRHHQGFVCAVPPCGLLCGDNIAPHDLKTAGDYLGAARIIAGFLLFGYSTFLSIASIVA